jgi:predicted NAD-dependent protein-ADP-ribosyltransferase YbiA (DUF1768 family)
MTDAAPEPSALRSVDQLIACAATGVRVKYLHFWGHGPQRDGSVGPGCLSQWWPAPFTVDSVNLRGFALMEARGRLSGGVTPV